MNASSNKTSAPNAPTWNLSDLYRAPDAPELEADLAGAETDASAFNKRHAGHVAALDGSAFGAAILDYEGDS